MTERGASLLAATASLIDIPSVSRNEAAIADLVQRELARIPGLDVVRVGDNVVARTLGLGPTRVVLAGHLDTVPPTRNERAVLEGDRLVGLGAADMKGGLAVLLALAPGAARRPLDTTYVFYAREEIARVESGLLELEAFDPELLLGDAAILLEPTGGVVEVGCQGSLRVAIGLGGTRAHSARPWTGLNAIHRLAGVLEVIEGFGDVRPMVDGVEYRESLQAVGVEGGGTGNVVPDAARLLCNYRFAPDKTVERATAELEERFARVLESARGDAFEVLDAAPPAPPAIGHPVLSSLLAASGAPPRAKLAWTDVAFFAQRAVPAANFGPGDPLLAHGPNEAVTADELAGVFAVLDGLLEGAPVP